MALTEHRSTRNRILSLFRSEPGARLTPGEIAHRLGDDDIGEAIQELVALGWLCRVGKGRFAACETMGLHRGRIRVRANGSGTVSTEGGRIFVSRERIGAAIDGDVVVVKMVRGGGRHISVPEGSVTSVVERRRSGVSGVLRRAGDGWMLDPVDPALPRGIRVRTERLEGLREGKVVWGMLDPPGNRLSVRLSGALGDSLTPSVYVDAICRDHGFSDTFPPDVLVEASRAALNLPSAAGRRDFRGLPVITIDPVDARDFDDAVSLSREADGWLLGVHIADVAAYVPRGSAVDIEAAARGTSVYLPDRVIPMLPESLSNGACSLAPGEDRLARSVMLRYDRNGRRLGYEIVPSIIRSAARLNYEEALLGMRGAGSGHSAADPLLADMAELSSLLDRERESRGALDLGSYEFEVRFGADGWPEEFTRASDDESHRMIENFMVEANRAVAGFCGASSLPVVYRVHGEPDRDSAQRLRADLEALGIRIPRGRITGSRDLSRILESARSSPAFTLAREAVLRSLKKAVYSESDSGHFGLGLSNYMHFTSPIRRYPDLVVHQVLSFLEATGAVLSGGPWDADVAGLAEDCSDTEQAAEDAERECMEMMALLYLYRRPGGEFKGIVSGVEDYSVFVRLADLPIDGLAPARLHNGSCIRLESLSLGESVTVEVHSVDPELRQLTLKVRRAGKDAG